jgi:hypothetical protein
MQWNTYKHVFFLDGRADRIARWRIASLSRVSRRIDKELAVILATFSKEAQLTFSARGVDIALPDSSGSA